MARITSGYSTEVPIYPLRRKLLDANPNRLLYSIQNLDPANYIAISPDSQVTAGVYGLQEGQRIFALQPMSDDTDLGEVWATADTAAVNVAIVEISNRPDAPGRRNPRRPGFPLTRRTLRQEARTF